MPLNKHLHNKIMKEGKVLFNMLENYDETHEWPIGRKRIDITINKRVLKKLFELRNKTGKPISRIIEDAVAKLI